MKWKHTITLKKLQLAKKMFTQPVVYYIISISTKHYKLISIDLSKQQALDVDPKITQQTKFTRNLDRDGNTTIFSLFNKQNNFRF